MSCECIRFVCCMTVPQSVPSSAESCVSESVLAVVNSAEQMPPGGISCSRGRISLGPIFLRLNLPLSCLYPTATIHFQGIVGLSAPSRGLQRPQKPLSSGAEGSPLLSAAVTAAGPAGPCESRWPAISQGGNQGQGTCLSLSQASP